MEVEVISTDEIDEVLRKIVVDAYSRGLRSAVLENQPAPWVVGGLKILEAGRELMTEDIRRLCQEGGTDHPDPWYG